MGVAPLNEVLDHFNGPLDQSRGPLDHFNRLLDFSNRTFLMRVTEDVKILLKRATKFKP